MLSLAKGDLDRARADMESIERLGETPDETLVQELEKAAISGSPTTP